ncbi:TOG array regulator of axonemal microtubules protein 1-like [Glandiceps talaboti]
MKVLMDLMQILTPKPVLNLLSDCLQHRNSRVREEALNVVIASLLTFPSYDFDLGQLCQTIAHTLVDPKRRVRQASLEAFAVLAQAMGPGRLQPLVSAVDSVELSMEGDGVMGAVQARLARRQLPRLNEDGMVEYSNPLPASATTRGSPPSADIEWILAAAGGGSSSARDRHSDHSRELPQPMSARSTSGSSENTGPTPAPRRYHSAGRNRKNKLPWEELPSEENNTETDHAAPNYKSHPNSAPSQKRLVEDKPPLKARNTWSDLDDNSDHSKSYRLIKASGGSRDQSPDTGSGSYRQIHLNKLKRERDRASLGSHPTAFGGQSEDQTGSHSAPVADRGETDILTGSTKKRNGRQDSKDRDDKYFPSFGTAKDEEFLAQRKSLASSWPDPAKDTSPKPRKRIDPLSEPTTPSTSYPPEWPGSEESPKKNKVNQSPIPLKPTLARSATRKTKHVPPLMLSDKGPKPLSDLDNELDSAYVVSAKREDDFDDFDDDDDDFDAMQNSLQSLRNSAARKRAARKSDLSTTSRSPSPPFDESGIYSVLYDSLESSPKSTPKKKGKKASDSPFSNKPRVARTSGSEKESPDTSKELEPNPFEFSPTGGVTFRDKIKSDVSVVGQGYGKQDSNHASHTSSSSSLHQQRTDSPPIPTHARSNARERRRQTKGNVVSPLTMASLSHPGAVDNDDFSEEVGVVGKGMFGTSYAPPTHEYSSDKNKKSKDRRDADGGQYKSPKGVYGVYGRGVKQNSQEENDSSDEELSNISISKSTKDKMAKKQMEMEQKKAEKQAEKEKRAKEQEIWYKQQEKEREKARELRLEKLKQIEPITDDIRFDTLTVSGSGSSNTPTKSKAVIGKPPVATTPKKKITKSPSSVSDSSPTKANTSLNRSQSLQEADGDSEELKPFGNPDAALRDALRFLQNEDWEVKIDGLNYIKRLTVFHPDTLCLQLHTVVVAVLAEMKNLRSSVSRLAICVVAEMFNQLKFSMDKDLDQLCKGLLQKAGESNGFIREDVDKSLVAMVSCVTPQRALVALIAGGGGHRNVAVRKTCAQFLVDIVSKMGPGRLLSGIKDITDKIVPTAVAFCLDPNPETRYYGRKIMYQLMNHEDFEKLLTKYVSQKDLRPLKDIIERLRQDGLGEMPSDTPSARARRSNASSGSGSRSNSGSREKTKSASSDVNGLTPPGSTRKVRRSPRMDEASMEQVKELRAALSASDWRDRLRATQDLQDLSDTNVELIASNIVKIFDDFTPRLSDSNSKVNLTALNTMLHLVPRLREYLGAVINTVVPVLGTNLASKNAQIHQTTSEVLDSLMEHMENSLLLQPFANLAQFGNARVKPDMIEKLAYLSSKVYSRKQQSVTRYVLPVLWHLLSNTTGSGAVPGGTGNLRTATANLANSLYAIMGQSMIDVAQSNLTPRNLKTLQDMLESP